LRTRTRRPVRLLDVTVYYIFVPSVIVSVGDPTMRSTFFV